MRREQVYDFGEEVRGKAGKTSEFVIRARLETEPLIYFWWETLYAVWEIRVRLAEKDSSY